MFLKPMQDRARGALRALMALMPKEAVVRRYGEESSDQRGRGTRGNPERSSLIEKVKERFKLVGLALQKHLSHFI